MARALSGFLSDVDLDEVLRVVALSRRSGLLDVAGPDTHAELHFQSGRLVRVRLHDTVETVGEVLIRHGILDAGLYPSPGETLEGFVARFEAAAALQQILVRVDDTLHTLMSDAVRRVLGWSAGSFEFRLMSAMSPPSRFLSDTAWTLPAGLDVEDLVRDVRRRRVERSTPPSTPASSLPEAVTARAPGLDVLLVDDDPAFLATVEQAMSHAGVSLVAFSSAQHAVERVRQARADNIGAIVVDLVMPRTNGRGILGGLELLRVAHDSGVAGRSFLLIDDHHVDAESFAVALGATVLRRPSRSSVLEGFLPIMQRLNRPVTPLAGFDLARELARELSDDERSEWRQRQRAEGDDDARSLETLKALLGELNHPSFEEEIPLLMLRFASTFFVRGALFTLDRARDELVGLGGFGVGGSDPGRLVRSIRIPLAADTIFRRAVAERCGVSQPMWESEWNTRFLRLIGGQRPREVYAAPLISPRGLEAVLYADNGGEPRPLPDVALLEIFLQQAAAAVERSVLAREVQTLRQSSIPTPVN